MKIEGWGESLLNSNKKLLDILLFDRTSRKNILWATDYYEYLGDGYEALSEITSELIIGGNADLIQSRTRKTRMDQTDRTRDNAEVFTPSWICNKQNNLIDAQWFYRQGVFNIESGETWRVVKGKISFEDTEKDWKKYVDAQRLEISCGEAPYLVSRYDTVTGKEIQITRRIGFLDRKMRIVEENANTADEWLAWSRRAFESVYGYEYQGDNVLLARKNLFFTYIDYYYQHFTQYPGVELLKNIAHIISWNIWQMDGLKCVIPGSCKPVEEIQIPLFNFIDAYEDESSKKDVMTCPGCRKNDVFSHTGIYCKIMDWRSDRSRTYLSVLKEASGHAGI